MGIFFIILIHFSGFLLLQITMVGGKKASHSKQGETTKNESRGLERTFGYLFNGNFRSQFTCRQIQTFHTFLSIVPLYQRARESSGGEADCDGDPRPATCPVLKDPEIIQSLNPALCLFSFSLNSAFSQNKFHINNNNRRTRTRAKK